MVFVYNWSGICVQFEWYWCTIGVVLVYNWSGIVVQLEWYLCTTGVSGICIWYDILIYPVIEGIVLFVAVCVCDYIITGGIVLPCYRAAVLL